MMTSMNYVRIIVVYFFLLLASCTNQKPEAIDFHKDSCHYCKMVITDKRFGAEIVTAKGKIYKFDALECMQNFVHNHPEKIGKNHKKYVVDTSASSKEVRLLPVEDAIYYVDPRIRSPMGRGYMTSDSDEGLRTLVGSEKAKEFIRWNELLPTLPSAKMGP